MNPFAVWHAATAYWPLAVVLGVIGLGFMFPAVSVPVLRFVLGTERRRWVVALVLVAGIWWIDREARFSDGYSAAVAEQAAKAESARADAEAEARRIESEHALAMWRVGARYEQDKADAEEQHSRDLAALRDGTLRLRPHWTCPTAPAAATGGEPDAGADLRFQGASDLVRLADEADAQIRGLQAVIEADRK